MENRADYTAQAALLKALSNPIRLEIDGEKGSVLLEGETVTVSLKGEKPYRILPCDDVLEGESYWGNNHLAQIREFYQSIREDRQPPVPTEEAAATLETVLALYRSARLGARQTLPLRD